MTDATQWVWKDGGLLPWNDAAFPVLAHGIHYGSGVVEGLRGYATGDGVAVFRLDSHIQRFLRSAKLYRMDLRYQHDALCSAVCEVIARNGLEDCYVRPIAVLGVGTGLNPTGISSEVAILAWPWQKPYLGREAGSQGIRTVVSSWRRIGSDALIPEAKATGHYLNSALAKVEAVNAGADEAIMLNQAGFVAEGPAESVFLVQDETLVTPSLASGILPGVTRATIIELAGELGIPVVERNVARAELYLADEVFLVGTAAEVAPVITVDYHEIGSGGVGQMTAGLQSAYERAVTGCDTQHVDWLTFVGRDDERR